MEVTWRDTDARHVARPAINENMEKDVAAGHRNYETPQQSWQEDRREMQQAASRKMFGVTL